MHLLQRVVRTSRTYLLRSDEVLIDFAQLMHTQVDILLGFTQLLGELVDREHLALDAQESRLEHPQRVIHLPHLVLRAKPKDTWHNA